MTRIASRDLTVSQLMQIPAARKIILRHLESVDVDTRTLESLDGSFREMFDMNMGGGIPYDTIVALMEELDQMALELPEDNMVPSSVE